MLAVETRLGGTDYRSQTEAEWHAVLTKHGVRHEYEPFKFLFKLVAPRDWIFARTYVPDFWLSDLKLWLEVKPHAPNLIEYRKAALLAECTGAGVLVTTGGPIQSDELVFVKDLNTTEVVSTVANGSRPRGPLKLDLEALGSAQFHHRGFRPYTECLIDAIDASNAAYMNGHVPPPRRKSSGGTRKRVIFLPPEADHRKPCFCDALPVSYCWRCRRTIRAYVTDECDERLQAVSAR